MKSIVSLTSALCASVMAFSAHAAPTVIPDPPSLGAKGYVLMDYHSGEVLVAKNADTQLNPASLTKLMTAYVAGQEMNRGNIRFSDQVVISRNAWAKNFPDSSKMFIEVGTSVSLEDLYRGLIIQSGNDASVAIAEHVAGSQDAFVSLMNSWADKLGLPNSAFTNPHGLDSTGLYSTPRDIAKLGQAIIRDLPSVYPMYSETSFTYNGITQYNRNGLLRDRSIAVDGMKTGFTSGAGYSLATSATSGNMRLISVVMGSNSISSREAESKQLLSYGFRFFDTVSPTKANQPLADTRIWMGEKNQLSVGLKEDIFLTLPKGDTKKLQAELIYLPDLSAPILRDQVVGQVVYKVEDKVVKEVDLVALESVEQGGLFKRITDWFKRWLSNLF
ncbi:D-alanyl-D-alanine carboxypeptidase [Vibrio vulnificus]|uniref:D-alanyl-D-alanine carboxypeptidase family protein n=1 Tax=Vibrio vulnificus TaxID=672 RepID=UPI001CDC3F55|nr:D-alanyl-D-alanine carboxypeptidase family protein [Vibrio vulnificus]MCA3938196.1 D-alanyl-D-alanine carboxypeptidase [Vibrio vulnificus]